MMVSAHVFSSTTRFSIKCDFETISVQIQKLYDAEYFVKIATENVEFSDAKIALCVANTHGAR